MAADFIQTEITELKVLDFILTMYIIFLMWIQNMNLVF